MALKKTIAKLDDYFERLKDKEAKRIKVKHVDKIIEKLAAKKNNLERDIEDAEKPSRKVRLTHKLEVVESQIEKAEFLRNEILKPQNL